MAFPVTTLRELGGFHPDLDRMGIKQLSGGDTEMMIRVATEARRRILYDPALKVRHLIHPSRLTREYILHRAYWDGRSACRLSRLHPGMGGAKEAIFTLFGGILRQTLGLKRGEIFEQAQVVWSRGYLKEWLLRRRA
jgi:hypothetical protein